jgi:hypothetical protein
LLPFSPERYDLSHAVQKIEYTELSFAVVLYEYETLRADHKLRVFENRVLSRIFKPKKVGVTGRWRKLHNEELHNFYFWPSVIRMIKSWRIRWAGHIA